MFHVKHFSFVHFFHSDVSRETFYADITLVLIQDMVNYLYNLQKGEFLMSWKKALTITTILTGATSVGIHLINKAIHISATIDHLLSSSSETYYDWKFGKIFYTKQGQGTPLLLVHDLTTSSSEYEWKNVIKTLAKTRTVYSLDLLGCGRSDKPNLTYTNYLYVQLINDFIKNVIKEKSDVIVTGQSSSFILGACQNSREIIDNIVMINPADIYTTAHIPTNSSRILTKLILLPLIGTLLYNILVRKDNIEKHFREYYFYDKSKIKHEEIMTYYEAAHYGNASSKYLFASLSGNYLTANIMLYLKDLSNSIFVVTGDNERNKSEAAEYQKILPSIEIFHITESGYLPQLETPDKLLEQIKICLNI